MEFVKVEQTDNELHKGLSYYTLIETLRAVGTSKVVCTKEPEQISGSIGDYASDIVIKDYIRSAHVSELRRFMIEYKLFDVTDIPESSLYSDFIADWSILKFNDEEALNKFVSWIEEKLSQAEKNAKYIVSLAAGTKWDELFIGWGLIAFARANDYSVSLLQ